MDKSLTPLLYIHDWQERFSLTVLNSGFAENVLRLTKQEYMELETKEEEIFTVGHAQKTHSQPMKSIRFKHKTQRHKKSIRFKHKAQRHKILIKRGRPKMILTKILQKLKAKQKQQHVMTAIKRIKQLVKGGNSMSNHPGHDTLTSHILFIFSLFVDTVERINP